MSGEGTVSGNGTITQPFSGAATAGIIDVFDAASGVRTGGEGRTNVMAWDGMFGRYSFSQYNPTNQPFFHPSYGDHGTNLPAIVFVQNVTDAIHLRADPIAPLVSNVSPLAIIVVVNKRTISGAAATRIITFSYSGSTNINHSIMGFGGNSANQMRFFRVSDTNDTFTSHVKTSAFITNAWGIAGFYYTGLSNTLSDNGTYGTMVGAGNVDPGQITLDRCSMGNMIVTNTGAYNNSASFAINKLIITTNVNAAINWTRTFYTNYQAVTDNMLPIKLYNH